MSNNMDVSLATLASEVNELHKGNMGGQEAMGHKLIAIRELLREKNGVTIAGKLDATGKPAPLGWRLWVKENLIITQDHAARCIRYVADPEGQRKSTNATRTRLNKTSAATLLRTLNNIWPNLSEADRDKVIDRVLTLAKEVA
jgi:hypothetical protein